MRPRLLDRWESQNLVDDYLGSLVRDERRPTSRVVLELTGAELAALDPQQTSDLIHLLQRIARLPGIEMNAPQRDRNRAPDHIRLVHLPRPVPRITDALLPGQDPRRSAFVDDRGYDQFMRDSAHLFPGNGTVL